MKTYRVKTKYVFSGTFIVEAESQAQARELVEKNCGMEMRSGVHAPSGYSWSFSTHPDVVIGGVRRLYEKA